MHLNLNALLSRSEFRSGLVRVGVEVYMIKVLQVEVSIEARRDLMSKFEIFQKTRQKMQKTFLCIQFAHTNKNQKGRCYHGKGKNDVTEKQGYSSLVYFMIRCGQNYKRQIDRDEPLSFDYKQPKKLLLNNSSVKRLIIKHFTLYIHHSW